MNLKKDEFDFIDFGSSNGGYIDLVKRRLKFERELGIEINPTKVEKLRARGYNVIQADLCKLELPANCVKAVTMAHVLEHLPNLRAIHNVIGQAVQAASRFVIIEGPWFESDRYLKKLGLKLCWSDWTGHQVHLRIKHIIISLRLFGISCIRVAMDTAIENSAHKSIVPYNSAKDQLEYNGRDKKSIASLQGVHSNFLIVGFKKSSVEQQQKILGIRSNFLIWV